MDDVQRLSNQFTDDMLEGVRSLSRDYGYNATRFLQMVHEHGGVGAAKRLVASGPRPTEGLFRLQQVNQLHRSVEAWILRPEYEPLFEDDDRDSARRCLEAYGFDVSRYEDGLRA